MDHFFGNLKKNGVEKDEMTRPPLPPMRNAQQQSTIQKHNQHCQLKLTQWLIIKLVQLPFLFCGSHINLWGSTFTDLRINHNFLVTWPNNNTSRAVYNATNEIVNKQ